MSTTQPKHQTQTLPQNCFLSPRTIVDLDYEETIKTKSSKNNKDFSSKFLDFIESANLNFPKIISFNTMKAQTSASGSFKSTWTNPENRATKKNQNFLRKICALKFKREERTEPIKSISIILSENDKEDKWKTMLNVLINTRTTGERWSFIYWIYWYSAPYMTINHLSTESHKIYINKGDGFSGHKPFHQEGACPLPSALLPLGFPIIVTTVSEQRPVLTLEKGLVSHHWCRLRCKKEMILCWNNLIWRFLRRYL